MAFNPCPPAASGYSRLGLGKKGRSSKGKNAGQGGTLQRAALPCVFRLGALDVGLIVQARRAPGTRALSGGSCGYGKNQSINNYTFIFFRYYNCYLK